MSEWLNIVEQVTPESAISSEVREAEPIRLFLCMQFEPESLQNRRSRETWIAEALTVMLERACAANDGFQHDEAGRGAYRSEEYPDGSSSIFFSLKQPAIVLRQYILRLVRYMRVSKSVFVVALIYLDRVRHDDKLLSLNYLNVHRLLTTALGLAGKYLEDESHKNSTIARIGGVPSGVEMNMLEVEFLRRIGWNCGVSEMAYEIYERTAFGEEERCERLESGRT